MNEIEKEINVQNPKELVQEMLNDVQKAINILDNVEEGYDPNDLLDYLEQDLKEKYIGFKSELEFVLKHKKLMKTINEKYFIEDLNHLYPINMISNEEMEDYKNNLIKNLTDKIKNGEKLSRNAKMFLNTEYLKNIDKKIQINDETRVYAIKMLTITQLCKINNWKILMNDSDSITVKIDEKIVQFNLKGL